MLIILRAVTLGFLSSFSFACATWQYSHSTPNDAAINCIEGITCSAGIPFSAWIFLNSSSASFGPAGAVAALGALDCAHAPAIASNKHINVNVPHTASQNFAPFRFTILTLADKLTKPHAARLQEETGFSWAQDQALISPCFANAVMRSAARNASASMVMVGWPRPE